MWRDVDNPEAGEAKGWWLGVVGLELSCEVLKNQFFGHRFSKEGVILLNIYRLAAAKLALYEEEAWFKQRLGLYSFHFCLSSP